MESNAMADTTASTPSLEDVYRDLEHNVADAHGASIVLETIMETAFQLPEGEKGAKTFHLTEDQVTGVFLRCTTSAAS
jgi:hypothetical protein